MRPAMHILTLTTLFPSSVQPLNAIFVRNRMEAVVRRYGHRWTVVAPVPYYPRLPFRTRPAYDTFARVPYREEPWGLISVLLPLKLSSLKKKADGFT